MSRLYKDIKKGKSSKNWYIEYRNENGKAKREAAFPDKEF